MIRITMTLGRKTVKKYTLVFSKLDTLSFHVKLQRKQGAITIGLAKLGRRKVNIMDVRKINQDEE